MKDKVIIQKIHRYLDRIDACYQFIEKLTEDDLLEVDQSYALTQYIINVNGLYSNLDSDEIAAKLSVFDSRLFSKCRNIAAHDYDQLDWSMVKALCQRMLKKEIRENLAECLVIADKEAKTQKDYAQEFADRAKLSDDLFENDDE